MKKAISIVFVSLFLLSLNPIPVKASATITDITDENLNKIFEGVFGDRVYVFGDGVTAGVEVNLYWDSVSPWDGEQGLMNSSEAYPNGSFEIWFSIPDAVNGPHYLWIKDTATSATDRSDSFAVEAVITVSPRSGLKNDEVTIKGHGFGDRVDVDTITFDADPLTTNPSVPVTSESGYWEATFNVPDKADGDYNVAAEDEDGNTASVVFVIGPAIALDVEKGPVGTVVEVDGRGFTEYGTVTLKTLGGIDCGVLDNDDLDIDRYGKFRFELVVPSVNQAGSEYQVEVTDSGGQDSNADFLVEGLTEIELDPQFGAPGSSITIQGRNFAAISGSGVVISVGGDEVKTLYTNSKGEFSGSFTIPAISSGTYDVMAEQGDYNIEDSQPFRVGTMIVILAPKSGPTGTKVTLTGTGFTAGGEWNATFGDVVIFEGQDVSGDTTFFDTFYVPTVDSGEYTVTVTDVNEDIELKTRFTVTGNTSISVDPAVAPVGYNVTIEGIYFAESDRDIEVEFTIYNSTDEWDMAVYLGAGAVYTGEDGDFTAWWVVPNDLSVGSYAINATDEEGLMAHVVLNVTSKFVSISPYKSMLNRGETVRFNIESSFAEIGSYIKVWDPDGELYWQTDKFREDVWIKVGTLEKVPYYEQTAGGNPLILDDEAPLGTWTWTWFNSEDEELGSGEFSVVEPTSDEGDTGDGGTTEVDVNELQQEIEDLKEELDKVRSDLDGLTSAMDKLAGDTSASVSEASLAAEDAREDASEAKEDADDAKNIARQAQDDATEARAEVEKASNSTRNLNTMFYVAFGASLIAILLGFVGPIQISRKT